MKDDKIHDKGIRFCVSGDKYEGKYIDSKMKLFLQLILVDMLNYSQCILSSDYLLNA